MRSSAPDELLQELQLWSEAGWIRRLDSAFADFIATQCPAAAPEALLAVALLVHLEGQGHTCVRVDELVNAGPSLLGWPAEPAAALAQRMARLPRAADAWVASLEALQACAGVDANGVLTQHHQRPLVLAQRRLYLRRYWRYERSVAGRVNERAAAAEPVDLAQARHWLARLFPPRAEPTPDWQKVACAIALRGRLSIITGGPGTGKTYTAARLLALFLAVEPDPQRLRIGLAAPTGKAAARLKQSIDSALAALPPALAGEPALHGLAARIGPARTLHAWLGARPDTRHFRHGAANPVNLDLLIVDEASMVHLEMMAALLEALPRQARLVLLGDKDQLASVEAGSVLGDLCRGAEAAAYDAGTIAYLRALMDDAVPAAPAAATGTALAQQTVMLRESRRFAGPIGQLATAVNAGDGARARALLHAPEPNGLAWHTATAAAGPARVVVRLAAGDRAGAAGGYGPYGGLLRQRPPAADEAGHAAWVRSVLDAFEGFRVLCAVRDGPWGMLALNAAIEAALVQQGVLARSGEWYEGRPVMVTRNDAAAGVFNGDVGIALRAPGPGGASRVWFADGAGVRSVLGSRLAHVETAFAMTVHKSQGSEFEHTVLVLPEGSQRGVTRELVYTGITRARRLFSLVSNGVESLDAALRRQVQRASGLAERD